MVYTNDWFTQIIGICEYLDFINDWFTQMINLHK
jgi:hypothetical protein